MDFQQLLAKMAQLDQPVGEAKVEECGEPMMGGPGMMGGMGHSETPPPSMSVNINAQGLDNIEELLKLVAKVNPDAAPKEPMGGDDLGGPDMLSIKTAPTQLLPGIDDGSDHDDGVESPEGDDEVDTDDKFSDDGFGDETEEDEAFGNSPLGGTEPEYKGLDAAIPNGNDLNKKKMTFPKVSGGDNPMLTVRVETKEELRASIREELLRRLNEGKDEGKPGKNFAKIAKKAGKKYGSKEAGERVAGAVRAKLAKQGKL